MSTDLRFRFKLFDALMVFLKEFLEKNPFEKNQQTLNIYEKFPSTQRINLISGKRLNSKATAVHELLQFLSSLLGINKALIKRFIFVFILAR